MKASTFLGPVVLAVVAMMCAGGDARATQSGAFVGNPESPSADWTCFHESYGAVVQSGCSGSSPPWEVGLPVGGSGDIIQPCGLNR